MITLQYLNANYSAKEIAIVNTHVLLKTYLMLC